MRTRHVGVPSIGFRAANPSASFPSADRFRRARQLRFVTDMVLDFTECKDRLGPVAKAHENLRCGAGPYTITTLPLLSMIPFDNFTGQAVAARGHALLFVVLLRGMFGRLPGQAPLRAAPAPWGS